MWIGNEQIALRIDSDLGYQLYGRRDSSWMPVTRAATLDSHRIRINNDWVSDFDLVASSISSQLINNVFGPGRRWTVHAASASFSLTQIITLDCYDAYPKAILMRVSYENTSQEPLIIDHVVQNELELDASLWQPWTRPYRFWAFSGASYRWGQKVVFPLNPDTDDANYLGQVESGEGGGIPLLYVWNRQVGVALAHLEPTPALWHMPLRVAQDGTVHLAFEQRSPTTLAPGERVDGLRTMVSAHQGDYFDALALYADLMRAQGWKPAEPSPAAYEPAWCGWGYEFDFTVEEMLGVIPMLKELEIRWATVDDRWFDAYGDWAPRRDTFRDGEADIKRLVDTYHAAGIRVQLWWYPLAAEDNRGAWPSHAYRLSDVVAEHPEWLILDETGRRARNNRNLAILCPGVPEVQDYIVSLTERFIGEWGFDGHKLDNVYSVPPCYNPAHGHAHPEESVKALAELYRLIHETSRRLKPESVTLISPCGTPPNVYLMPYVDQPMMSDPYGSWQIRQRIKILKALMGPDTPVFADHVELTDNAQDFASMVGPGGVPGTKFVWPHDPWVEKRLIEAYYLLDERKQAHWATWLGLYRELMLAQGEYLNLYDTIYERPEGHVVAKGERLYYAFFTDLVGEDFEGVVPLKGLDKGRYRLRNVETGQALGTVQGPRPRVYVHFQSHLLLEATPD
jgi:alpha-galactosidase